MIQETSLNEVHELSSEEHLSRIIYIYPIMLNILEKYTINQPNN